MGEPTCNCASGFWIPNSRHEAHTAHGVQQLRFPFCFHLFAQVAHVDIEGVGVANKRSTPHGIENRLARLHFIGIAYQEQQQFKLPLRERNAALSPLNAAFDRIQP